MALKAAGCREPLAIRGKDLICKLYPRGGVLAVHESEVELYQVPHILSYLPWPDNSALRGGHFYGFLILITLLERKVNAAESPSTPVRDR